ncbi:hypothetical protein [uncultured Tateyamaria sp.]|uniref:hypothetical protein n=1 Tax=uncultured Tateyamaria sp. TaxID=455651 RepID=UPI00261C88EE|nr:hypothetical protein [uncultured Tateyamaria sp.]
MKRTLIVLMALALAGCEDVVSEQEGSFLYDGETYRAVTRQYVRNGSTFERRVIYSRPQPVTCSATDDLDCIGAMRSEWLDVR